MRILNITEVNRFNLTWRKSYYALQNISNIDSREAMNVLSYTIFMKDVLSAQGFIQDVLEPIQQGKIIPTVTSHAEKRLKQRDITKEEIFSLLKNKPQGILLQPPEPRFKIWYDKKDTDKDIILILGYSNIRKSYNIITTHKSYSKRRHHE